MKMNVQRADRALDRRLANERNVDLAMKFSHKIGLLLAGTSTLLAQAGSVNHLRAKLPSIAGATVSSDLSVLTYNIHGMPWPFAKERDDAYEQIEDRLSAMRGDGRQPHIVLLQEAFTNRAREIGKNAGYAYVVDGPSSSQAGEAVDLGVNTAFARDASFTKGETVGKYLGSGLQILSDYPILSMRRAAFPSFACAGYDCLANKGVLLVTIRIPGQTEPVTIVTTHMNSKRASGVSEARSAEAYQMQAKALNRFVGDNRDEASPIIFGGDFNASNMDRRRTLADETLAPLSSRGGSPVRNGLAEAVADSHLLPRSLKGEVNTISRRGRDWQFIANGTRNRVTPVAISVPFGLESDGTMLSDHMGLMISYRLAPRS
jgi:endonuclease/exonuclease/phosphatase family metal-dependent hydrolase